MKHFEAIELVALKLNLPIEVTKKAYESYWEYVRNLITQLPLREELTEDLFKELRTNFNVPSIGKLSCTYSRYIGVKKRYKFLQELRKKKNDNNN